MESLSETEHWRVVGLENFAPADIHVHATREARIKATHGTHDVDTLELVWSVLFEDRRVLHGVFVRARRPVNITGAGIPGCRRVRVIVADLPVSNHNMVRKHASNSFVEAAANGVLGNFEFRPCFVVSGPDFVQSPLAEVKSSGSRIRLEIRSSAVAFDGIAPLWNPPFEFRLRKKSSLW